MRHLRPFRYYRPSSVSEILELLEGKAPGVKLLAGGTDLLVQMKEERMAPEGIIDLGGTPELGRIESRDGRLRVGAMVRLSALENLQGIHQGASLISSAAHRVGSPQIRFRGTIGGNLCNASPAADMAPALLVMEASVTLASKKGERRIPLESFFTGPGMTVLKEDEMLKEIDIPGPPGRGIGVYLKLGRRRSMDLALVSIALLLSLGPDRQTCERVRVAFGSVAPVPLRAKETEGFLEGKKLTEDILFEASQLAEKESQPITDVRATAAYRKEMVGVLFRRAMREALAAGR